MISTKLAAASVNAALLVLSASTTAAQVIDLDAADVTASSELAGSFNRTVDQIVDESGLTAGQHTTLDPNNTMWLTTGSGFDGIDPDPWVQFDLGDVYTITSFQVWNYNELAGSVDLTTRGVKGVSVEYGLNESLGSTVPGINQFAQADATNTYTGEVFNGFAPFDARYIKFDIDEGINVGNYGDTNTFYGLSEVQFTGTLVPEPGSLALLAIGGLLIARRRRA